MSALTITRKTFLADAGITGVVGQSVFPLYAPQGSSSTNIVIHLIHEDEEDLLQGSSQWAEARVSIECRAPLGQDADKLGEKVKDALRDKHLYQIDGCEVTFRKEGTDGTESEDTTGPAGVPTSSRRILDYYLRWRRL